MAAKAVVVFDSNNQPVVNAEASFGDNIVSFPLTKLDGYSLYPYTIAPKQTYIKVFANNYAPYLQTIVLDDQDQEIHIGGDINSGAPNTIHLPPLSFKRPLRPKPVQQGALPPFDNDDSGGEVHKIPPPELIIPVGRDLMFMRADFNGVTLSEKLGFPPYFKGANTTPPNMLMSPMMIMYPRKWQDAHLTESAERSYTHYVIAPDGWNLIENNFEMTANKLIQWAKYIQSWGFYVVYWKSIPALNDPILKALVDAHAVDWVIPGEEVDTKVIMEQYEVVLDNVLSIVANGIPVGAHFTANYPEGFPRDTFLTNWDKYDGKVHLMWQANQNESAGTQAARLYYGRQRVNLGLFGGNGQLALNSRTYAFETMATAQLYGKCTEKYGCLRSLELLYATRRDDRILPMSGYGNGGRLPDGRGL